MAWKTIKTEVLLSLHDTLIRLKHIFLKENVLNSTAGNESFNILHNLKIIHTDSQLHASFGFSIYPSLERLKQ